MADGILHGHTLPVLLLWRVEFRAEICECDSKIVTTVPSAHLWLLRPDEFLAAMHSSHKISVPAWAWFAGLPSDRPKATARWHSRLVSLIILSCLS